MPDLKASGISKREAEAVWSHVSNYVRGIKDEKKPDTTAAMPTWSAPAEYVSEGTSITAGTVLLLAVSGVNANLPIVVAACKVTGTTTVR